MTQQPKLSMSSDAGRGGDDVFLLRRKHENGIQIIAFIGAVSNPIKDATAFDVHDCRKKNIKYIVSLNFDTKFILPKFPLDK